MEKLELGTTLNGRYLLKGFIGEGNMSYVYEAFDELLKRMVAIKQMNVPLGSWDIDSIIKRFKREYYFLSAIEHPNVVKAHGFFSENNNAFMVLELIKGLSLQEMIEKRKNHISMSINLSFAIQLARAIEVINTAGIIHRDIKPTNIIVNETTKRLKLLDLGVATFVKTELSRLTNHGEVVGTPDYLSPEQVGGQVAANSDIFSVGVVLYQLFCGEEKSPFSSDNAMSTMMSITTQKLPPLVDKISASSVLYQKTYQRISDVLEESLEINPENRISDAGTLANKFEDILSKYRAEKSQLKERKTVILQNWVVSEKTDPDPEVMKKLRKLGDQFGRDDVSYKRPSSKRISAAIKRNKRYTEKVRKSSGILEWLIIFIILLVITLFIIIDFSSSEKKVTQSDLNNIAMEQLQKIKKMNTNIERWHSLIEFEQNSKNISSYIYEQVDKQIKDEEKSINEQLISAVSAVKSSNIFDLKEISKILKWNVDPYFSELLEKKPEIKNEYDNFVLMLKKNNQDSLLVVAVQDFYKYRNIEETKSFFQNISLYVNETSKIQLNRYQEIIVSCEKIFTMFAKEIEVLQKQQKKLSLFTVDNDKAIEGVIQKNNENTFSLQANNKEEQVKIFNVRDNTNYENLLKMESIDLYYPQVYKDEEYKTNIFNIACYGERDFAFCSKLAIKDWQQNNQKLMVQLLKAYEKQNIPHSTLEIFDDQNNPVTDSYVFATNYAKIKGTFSGDLSSLIKGVRILQKVKIKGKKIKKRYSFQAKNKKFFCKLPLAPGQNIFTFAFQIHKERLLTKTITVYRE